jgi:hypothetical protein
MVAALVVAAVGCSRGDGGATTPAAEEPATPSPTTTLRVPSVDPSANDLPCCDMLQPDELAAVEKLIAAGSTNCFDYARIAGHYMFFASPSVEVQGYRLARLMWLADHCPTKGQEGLLVFPPPPPPALVAKWEAQVKSHPDSAYALGNLAQLVDHASGERALDLYERAEQLDPANPRWPERQARILARGDFADVDDSIYPRAYTKLVRAVELTAETMRIEYEGDLAKAALHAGDLDKAQQHARTLLRHVDREPPTMWTGNYIYDAHATLGRVALRRGDVSAAKKHLLEAAHTSGSPTLSTFGPDMTLASELLDLGERDVVLGYLDLVEQFWEHHDGDLDLWREQIRRGQKPRLRH